MCPTTPLLSFDMQLNGQGSSFNNIKHSKPSSSSPLLNPDFGCSLETSTGLYQLWEKKPSGGGALSTAYYTSNRWNKGTPKSFRNTLMCSLIKNLSLSSDRYNYSFIWKNIYHAATEQTASSNKCLLNEHMRKHKSGVLYNAHTKRHLRASRPLILNAHMQISKKKKMPEFSSYGRRWSRPLRWKLLFGLGKRDGRIGGWLFILNKNALKELQKKEHHRVRYSKKTKISQQPCFWVLVPLPLGMWLRESYSTNLGSSFLVKRKAGVNVLDQPPIEILLLPKS